LHKLKILGNSPATPVFVCAVLLAGAISGPAYSETPPETSLPGSEIVLPEEEVKDRFFAYLIGLAEADAYGKLSTEDIGSALGDFGGKTRVPFELVTEIERRRGERGKPGVVRISFLEELKTPVPYSILGYHPGSVRADTAVTFHEWYLPEKSIWVGEGSRITLTRIHVYGTADGWAVVDIDAWIDKLLGGRLDDTWLVVLALFRYDEAWHGIAAGYGPGGEGRSGVFNFKTNNILFPTPDELRTLGPYFRNLVRRQKGLRAPVPGHGEWKEN
jgi:hypothetical protein